MFAGHAALALLAKSVRPRISIALLVPVAFAPDVIEASFAAFGRHNRELSHSLVAVGIAATLIAAIYALANQRATDVRSEALVVWLTCVSHWPADFITAVKPTWPGGPDVGLLLYDHPIADTVLECFIVLVCWIMYRRAAAHFRTGSFVSVVDRRLTMIVVPTGLIAAQIAFDVVQGHLLS